MTTTVPWIDGASFEVRQQAPGDIGNRSSGPITRPGSRTPDRREATAIVKVIRRFTVMCFTAERRLFHKLFWLPPCVFMGLLCLGWLVPRAPPALESALSGWLYLFLLCTVIIALTASGFGILWGIALIIISIRRRIKIGIIALETLVAGSPLLFIILIWRHL